MLHFNQKSLLLLLEALVYAAAAGTQGVSDNQWNQESPQQRFPQTKGTNNKGQSDNRWNQESPQQRPSQTKGPLGGWDDEVTNPQGGFPDEGWKLQHSIPGVPGQSYPNYKKIPNTSFNCRQQKVPGYYADMEAQCQLFHICQADGRQNSFLCPIGTAYNQETFVCDWWFNVKCVDASIHYVRNGNLYRSPYIGIDGSKVSSYKRGQGARENSQQPPVGIPSFESGVKGVNWPSQPSGQSHGQRRTNQGNQKGDIFVTQRRMGGGQNWQNRGSINTNVRQGVNNFERNQKGFMGGQHIDQQQQGVHHNQKGSMGGRHTHQQQHNQKGGSFQKHNNNEGWTQRGPITGGIQTPQEQIFNQQRGTKGEPINQRNPSVQAGSLGTDGNKVRHGTRMDTNRGINSNKGFDTNTWSIRAQNFQTTSQDRKGSSSDAWPSNYNSDTGSRTETSPNLSSWSSDETLPAGQLENRELNHSWNAEDNNGAQWEENNFEEKQWEKSYENNYDYS